MRVEETVWNTLNGGGTEKRERKTKNLKRGGGEGGKLDQGVAALKWGGVRGGLEPLYELWLSGPNVMPISFLHLKIW